MLAAKRNTTLLSAVSITNLAPERSGQACPSLRTSTEQPNSPLSKNRNYYLGCEHDNHISVGKITVFYANNVGPCLPLEQHMVN